MDRLISFIINTGDVIGVDDCASIKDIPVDVGIIKATNVSDDIANISEIPQKAWEWWVDHYDDLYSDSLAKIIVLTSTEKVFSISYVNQINYSVAIKKMADGDSRTWTLGTGERTLVTREELEEAYELAIAYYDLIINEKLDKIELKRLEYLS